MAWSKRTNQIVLVVGLVLLAVGIALGLIFGDRVKKNLQQYNAPQQANARARQDRIDSLKSKPLEIGDVVGVTFWGSPAVVTFAAFGSGTASENHLTLPAASDLLGFCDLPTATLAREYGKPPTTWITGAGIDWLNNRNICLSLSTGLDGQVVTCSQDSDCWHTFECDPTQDSSQETWCAPDGKDSDGTISIFQNPQCPACAPCVPDGKTGNYYCSLSNHASFTCDTSFATPGVPGICRVFKDAEGSFTCPPPPQCSLRGFTISGADNSTETSCSLKYPGGGVAPGWDSCTGCQPGQYCSTGPDGIHGSCTGMAQTYYVLRSQFRMEGHVATINEADEAIISWERLQMAYPYFYSNGTVSAPMPFMPWTKENMYVNSAYHLGCRILREWCDKDMQLQLFGTVDSTGQNGIAPTGYQLVSDYYAMTHCGSGTYTSPTSDCYSVSMDLAATSWPVQTVVSRFDKTMASPNDMALPTDAQYYTLETLGTAQMAQSTTLTAGGGACPYDIPTAPTYYPGIQNEVGEDPQEYMQNLVGIWTQDAVNKVESQGPWQFGSDLGNIFPVGQ